MNSTCPSHPIHLHFITMRLSTEQYTSFNVARHQMTPNINQLRNAHTQCNISDALTHLCLIISTIINKTVPRYISSNRFCFQISMCTLKLLAGPSVKCPLFWSNCDKHHNMSPYHSITSVLAILQFSRSVRHCEVNNRCISASLCCEYIKKDLREVQNDFTEEKLTKKVIHEFLESIHEATEKKIH
jgi:hypothetical protein